MYIARTFPVLFNVVASSSFTVGWYHMKVALVVGQRHRSVAKLGNSCACCP